MSTEPTADPLITMLRAPGTLSRLVAFLLAILALFTTAVSIDDSLPLMTVHDSVLGFGNLRVIWSSYFDVGPLAAAFPVLIAAALVLSAVPPVARYARLADLIGAVAGVVVSVAILLTSNGLTQFITNNLGSRMIGIVPPATLGPRAYAIFAATLILAVRVALPMLPRQAVLVRR